MPIAVTTRPPTRSPSGEKHTRSFQLDLELAVRQDLLRGQPCDGLRPTLRRTHRPDCAFNRVATGTASIVPCPLEDPAELGSRVERSKGRRSRGRGVERRRVEGAPAVVDEPGRSKHLVLAVSIRLPWDGQRITAARGWRGSPWVDEDPRHAEPAPEFAAPGADAAAGVPWVGPTVGAPRRREPARLGQVGAMTR